MIQTGGSVQYYRTIDTDLPKLCTARLQRYYHSEYTRANGDRDSLSFYQFTYRHPDGQLFTDTFGDSQWGFPGAAITNPYTYAMIDLENLGTTFAEEPTKFGRTVPIPTILGFERADDEEEKKTGRKMGSMERIDINILMDKLCTDLEV